MITKIDPIKVFYSYSHKDEYLRRELFNHLSDLRNQGLIEDLYDRNIGPGQDWQNKIDEHLESADIILLLVSSDFITSNYIRDVEIIRAIERHEADEAIIIPIFLRAVDCKDASFLKFQGLPTDAVPVMSWEKKDEAFADIAKGIRKVVDKLSIKANQYICRNKNTSHASLWSTECYLLLNANDDFSARIRETLLEKLEPEIIYATDPKNSEELYQMAVKDFIDSSAKWLLTIAHQNQLDFYTTEIFTRLNINTDKKFIFFDSGHKLIDDWKSMKSTHNAPIVVVETDHTMAAKTLLTKTTYYLPDVRNRISAVIMIPMIYPGNQRARVYHQFLGSMLSGEIQSNIPSLNSKELEVFKWHMKDWPTIEQEVENQVIENERSIVAVMDSDAAIFLCGNDKIAKGVRMALDKIKAKIKPYGGWKAKPILVGFDGSSQNRKSFEKSGYTLLTANIKLPMMCEDVTKLVRGKMSFPEDNKIPSTAIVEPIM